MRTLLIRLAAVSSLAVAVAGCNSNDLVAGDIFNPTNDGRNAPQPWNPHDADGDGTPDEPGAPETVPTEFDTDGDGIPDGDDLIPCQAFYIKLWNHNVSSSEVVFNGVTIIPSSFFPTDQVIIEFINPQPGVNSIEAGGRLEGSPGDELHMEVWDVDGVLYLHETVVRGNGTPEAWGAQFEINVQC